MNYKYLSALNVSDVFSVTLNTITDYLKCGNILDGKHLMLKDLDLIFI